MSGGATAMLEITHHAGSHFDTITCRTCGKEYRAVCNQPRVSITPDEDWIKVRRSAKPHPCVS